MPKKLEDINTKKLDKKNKSLNNTIKTKITKITTKNKSIKPILLKGGTNIIVATFDVFTSLIKLGENMITEFESIKNLPAQINNASAPVSGQPNTMQ
jgi:hypothetical protein